MSALDSKKTEKNLRKKGFVLSPGDHKMLDFIHDGKIVAHTKISHGSKKDIGAGLIKKMAEQCQISKDQFVELANCTLSEAQYIKILRSKEILD